ncbi:hypothetical protein PHLCEN_2v7517 [Hermanssonia centrifuga]|uniref:DNA polymerase n=1 Tax=Hermanssonia centrifuga TaxID=98765 RepID=A0A2R6NWA9_9APHY|nr:hypothetical protein PHLCEN_2v7517 [Hermanssonia centrifuga]
MDDMNTRITRAESEASLALIQELFCPPWEFLLAGSYRRGSPTSLNANLIALHPSHQNVTPPSYDGKVPERVGHNTVPFKRSSLSRVKDGILATQVIPSLVERGFISGTFTTGAYKWQGIARIPMKNPDGVWETLFARKEAIAEGRGCFRSVDISLVPMKSRGAALLALTGDQDFTHIMQEKAAKRGLLLNEFGLWRLLPEGEKLKRKDVQYGRWELVASETEEEIFDELQTPWVDPEKRNFSFLKTRSKKVTTN